MRFPLSQSDNLLVGLIEEHRDGVAVPNHGAYERAKTGAPVRWEEGATTCSTDGADGRCGARREVEKIGRSRIDSGIGHSGLPHP